jgi:hypothetical protein
VGQPNSSTPEDLKFQGSLGYIVKPSQKYIHISKTTDDITNYLTELRIHVVSAVLQSLAPAPPQHNPENENSQRSA